MFPQVTMTAALWSQVVTSTIRNGFPRISIITGYDQGPMPCLEGEKAPPKGYGNTGPGPPSFYQRAAVSSPAGPTCPRLLSFPPHTVVVHRGE